MQMIQADILNYQGDILNSFYKEFTLWDQNNESKLGVVLTPDNVVDIMIKELDIKQQDNVLDFCTGTGSFLIKAGKQSKNIFGCENNDSRYTLAKCGLILNNLDTKNLVHNSCFNEFYKQDFDKIIINPPFSVQCNDDDNPLKTIQWNTFSGEQKFMIYALQLLKENGSAAFIVPRSNFNNSSKQNEVFKQELLKYATIKKIICLNSLVFSPNASVQCDIIILEKKVINNYQTQIINFEEDGYKIKKCIRTLVQEKDYKKAPIQNRELKATDDWNFQKQVDKINNLGKLFMQYFTDFNYSFQNIQIQQGIKPVEFFRVILNNLDFQNVVYEKRVVKDYFEILHAKKRFQVQDSQEGIYPLISRTSQNNGIVKYIDDFSLDGDFLTVAPSGSTGSTFKQSGKFAVDGMVKVLKPLQTMNDQQLHIWAMILNYSLPQKYSYNNGLTQDKLLNEVIDYPINLNFQLQKEINKKLQFNLDFQNVVYEKRVVKDYFEIIANRKIIGNKSNTDDGNYPMISTSSQNNGIIKYVSQWEFDGEKDQLLTVSMTGSTGAVFVQKSKFLLTDRVRVLKPIKPISDQELHLWAMILNYSLPQKYSYSNCISKDKLLNEIVDYPVFK